MSEFELTDLDYELPPDLIAQSPLPRRDEARLLTVGRGDGLLADHRVADLPGLLRRGDLLILNDTKVVPAKFFARRGSGGRVKGLFLHSPTEGLWEVMLEPSGRLRVGESLKAEGLDAATPSVELELIESLGGGQWLTRVDDTRTAEQVLESIGRTPLPPYIRRGSATAADLSDRERYQTVYAARAGAVAAPTAGLHMTHELLERIRGVGIDTGFVTLHVGIGTFKPITAARIAEHIMHSERYELPDSTAEAIAACKLRGGRVVAVGTTTVRVLETAFDLPFPGGPVGSRGRTSIFIHPPYRFRVVDALLTNFHLPRSTLLALVMAFAGVGLTKRSYRHAVERGYRFYSYGDAMLLE